jgi:hypothetical protein
MSDQPKTIDVSFNGGKPIRFLNGFHPDNMSEMEKNAFEEAADRIAKHIDQKCIEELTKHRQ